MPIGKARIALISGCAIAVAVTPASANPIAILEDSAAELPSANLPETPKARLFEAGPNQASEGGRQRSVRKEMRRQADRVNAVLDEIKDLRPDHRAFIADIDTAQQDASQALDEFRARMEREVTADIVQMANDPENTYATRTARNANNFANMTASAISSVDLDRFRNSNGRDDLAMAQYFLMAYREEQLTQLARLYPNSEPIRAARTIAGSAMAKLGSLESVQQGRAAALAARVAATRLLPAVRRDAALESQIAAAFTSSIWTQQEFAESDIAKVNLTGPGWTVRRNPITGIIISRDRQAALAVRRRDGRCFSYIAIFEQAANGSGYGGTYMTSGRDLEMLCENIPR